MKLGPNAQAALEQVVEQFKTGDLSPIVKIARLQRNGDTVPSDRWSLSNRILAFVQTGSYDCRGYRQWQQVGRYVKRGSKAAFIFAPVLIPQEDPDTGEETPVLTGFKSVPVFAHHQTAGEELPEVSYAPCELPPLSDVAGRLGVEVAYQPLPSDRWGSCSSDGQKITLGCHDPSVFFHELAHSIHARIDGGLKRGQDPQQEAIAEVTAAVLMRLYGLGDRSGDCWRYIKQYAKDPLKAVIKALGKIEEVLAFLLADGGDLHQHADAPDTW
jgi:hypothetical protein